MTASNTRQSLSRRAALAGLGAGGRGLALAVRGGRVAAQDATPAATPAASLPTAGHLLVGAWEVDSHDGVPAATPEWAIFDADGTWVHYFPGGFALGAWRPTGERTAEGVEIYALFSAPLEGLLDLSLPAPEDLFDRPPIRFRFDVEVDASGDRFELAGAVVDAQGNATGSPGTITGVRLVAAPGAAATPTA